MSRLPTLLGAACLALASLCARADSLESAVDAIVPKVLADTGVPSASIAIVKDGRIVLAKAYGLARVQPDVPATPSMRYKIASNSKHLTATAILLLAEEGKLSLDDKVARFLPDLTRAQDVTIRELLTHTSGYEDYYADDYVPLPMQHETTAQGVLDAWAKKPLDFEPGTRWQYSNTGYVALGRIVEKASGRSLFSFLGERVFDKVGMKSPIDIDSAPWSAADPLPYTHYALGPLRQPPIEAKGWMSAAAELAMTASDLARWDIALSRGEILKPASLKAMTTEMVLADGTGTGYGLGLFVRQTATGRRRWSHSGEAAGFLSANVIFPDDKAAIVVLTNGEGPAFQSIEKKIEAVVMDAALDPDAETRLARAKELFAELQKGAPDRATLSESLNAYLSPQAVADFAASLGPLGTPTKFVQTSRSDRGGMEFREYSIEAGGKSLSLSTFILPDGRFEQCLVFAD